MPHRSRRLSRYVRAAFEARDPLQESRRRWAVKAPVAVTVAVVALGAAVLAAGWLLRPMPDSTAAPADPPSVAPAVSPGALAPIAESTGESEAIAVVHVAGAVANPGVVELSSQSRVIDAIEAVGGPTQEADLNALNLAATVTDGTQVYVPAVGEVGWDSSGTGSGLVNGPASGDGLVNLNSANSVALQTLPGIGPALAERIVSWRRENGPFASVEALTQVPGIGPATVDRLRERATV
ncbi:MAG: helix-hairpin-helix domain-containing protein [Beutenbergiaceae bacterium]